MRQSAITKILKLQHMLVIDIIHEKIKDGYKIFVEQYEDGRTYKLCNRIDETTKTVFAIISAKLASSLIAQYGPSLHASKEEYFGNRKEYASGDDVILFFNIHEMKLN